VGKCQSYRCRHQHGQQSGRESIKS
jgi:hypothetical protein